MVKEERGGVAVHGSEALCFVRRRSATSASLSSPSSELTSTAEDAVGGAGDQEVEILRTKKPAEAEPGATAECSATVYTPAQVGAPQSSGEKTQATIETGMKREDQNQR